MIQKLPSGPRKCLGRKYLSEKTANNKWNDYELYLYLQSNQTTNPIADG